MSKPKDVIIENTNLKTDENLYELSRGIAIVDIMPVFNSLVIYHQVVRMKNLFESLYVEHLPK